MFMPSRGRRSWGLRKVHHVTYILQHAGLPLLNTLGQERMPLYVYFVLGQCGLVRACDAEEVTQFFRVNYSFSCLSAL